MPPSPIVTSLLLRHPPSPAKKLPTSMRLCPVSPSVDGYRQLYRLVGGPYDWSDRLKMDDAALSAVITHPQVKVVVLRQDSVDLGYYELDGRRPGWVQLAYFGLAPAAVGKGVGRAFLHTAIHDALAWRESLLVDREPSHTHGVWVHTCTLDHPLALPLYESCGFEAYAAGEREVHPSESLSV